MAAGHTILITGMSGLIGRAVRRRLEGTYNLRALNRSAIEGVTTTQADISDLEAIQPAFQGVDAVVHLAAVARVDAPWDEVLQTNIMGTYNVFEAARRAGVSRVVYASSGATIAGWAREEPYRALAEGRYADAPVGWPKVTHETPVRPVGLYGASKVWGEALARQLSDSSPLSILCLRIGVVNQEDRPVLPGHFPIWCSQRDVAQMVLRCIEAPAELMFDIFYVTSDNKWGYRDLRHAREVVGYEPEDAAESYR
jgi:nucleoside-diphosphate-sugar epimerase